MADLEVVPAKSGEDFSPFARSIYEQKYAFKDEDGNVIEDWPETAKRVTKNVLAAVGLEDTTGADLVEQNIAYMKFIPGGRYLYASGRDFHQVNNCLLLRCGDSREGWSELLHDASMALMTGAGIGVDYSDVRASGSIITKTGGVASGPISVMQMINECGRHIMQGGSRRSAIWAGLNWKHNDIFDFIRAKDWSEEVRGLKEKDFNFPAALDMTNISVQLDDEFFEAMEDKNHRWYDHAKEVYHETTKRMIKTAEPGFSIDVGDNTGETLRNACLPGWSNILTPNGLSKIEDISIGDLVWVGDKWSEVTNKFDNGEKDVYAYKTTAAVFYGTEDHKVVSGSEKIQVDQAEKIDVCVGPEWIPQKDIDPQDVMDGLVLGDGMTHKASNNLSLLCIGENDQQYFNSEVAHLIGRDRSKLGPYAWEIETTLEAPLGRIIDRNIPDRFLRGNFDKARGLLRGLFSANGNSLKEHRRVALKTVNIQLVRDVQQLLSGMGIKSFITTNKAKTVKFSNGEYDCKEAYDLNIGDFVSRKRFHELIGFIHDYKNENTQYSLDSQTRINGGKTSFEINEKEYISTEPVYDIEVKDISHKYWAGGLSVSNCTELSSKDSSDICNLGSINMANIETLEEFKLVVSESIMFLIAGTVYSQVPYEDVRKVREKNRRLGLGLMGIHEWLLKRGYGYEPNAELEEWLEAYRYESDSASEYWSKELGLSQPVKVRAIAPTGTIGIIAETTTGIEPIFCVAMKRRYLEDGKSWKHQFIVDPTAKRLIENDGVNPEDIQDAYHLAYNVEKRIEFQAWVQQFVDHGISSTINLPYPITDEAEVEDFKEMLLPYLPKLRGITAYPDGSRGGQPLTPCPYEEAVKHEGVVFESDESTCVNGVCGS